MNNNVLAQVAALPNMKATELKKLWKDVFRADPPPFNKQYYVKRLAYRIQEVAYGVDSSRVDKRLSALCERDLDKPDKACKRLEVHRPVTGTRVVREWQGHEHHVTVLEDSVEYMGQRYSSLLVLALQIIDVRWNGLVFFGLKRMEDYRRV